VSSATPGPFPCIKGGSCFVWLHGTITFREDAHYVMAGGTTTVDKHEDMTMAVGLTRRQDGLPSALYRDTLSTSNVIKIPSICTVDLVSGTGSGKGHLEYGYGLKNHAWYWDKYYHVVFVPDIGFPATEKSDTKSECNYNAVPQSDYPKPTMAMLEFLTPARLTNPMTLQGKMITFGKLATGQEGEGTCQLPDDAKGKDVCTTTWKLTAKFSTAAQPGP
jgi:hypothetical protein